MSKSRRLRSGIDPTEAVIIPARGLLKPAIGWREWVTFPKFDETRIKAKIDTGARTSAIHAWNIEIITRRRQPFVSFLLHPHQRNNEVSVACVAPLVGERTVRNSGGQAETRLFIRTTISIGGQSWPIELSLTRRDEMGFRMLLGRTALCGRYVVDPSRSFMLGK
ncbi:MAG: ATP-dependent zinc protease [Hyphomicrobiaceae bacterium]